MSLKSLLATLWACTLLLWLTWSLVLFKIDPIEGGFLAISFFYSSLVLALLGTFVLAGYYLRRYRQPEALPYRLVVISLRQGWWFSLVVLITLILQSQNWLTWWNVALLILALGILEFFFISFKGEN
ncbi:MAG: hypothetical protein WCW02_00100 [Candidatus Buchananbacteria bacterium]